MRLYGQEPIKVSYNSAKFSGHRQSSIGDVVILVCRVISQDHVLYGQEPIEVSYHPDKFGGYRLSGSGDIMGLVCRVILT